MAMAHCPGVRARESPSRAAGRAGASSTLIRPTSVSWSTPITRPRYFFPLPKVTLISVALATTCSLVST